MMQPEPQAEHTWLQRMVGQWTSEMECDMGPDQPKMKSHGTETVRSLGGLWTIGEWIGEMPDGQPATTIMTLGYDTQKEKFLGTFVGSMMTNMWLYEGRLDVARNVLTLDTEGPDFSGGTGLVKYQDIMELVDDGHRILSSQVIGSDGKWNKFMTAHYYRKK